MPVTATRAVFEKFYDLLDALDAAHASIREQLGPGVKVNYELPLVQALTIRMNPAKPKLEESVHGISTEAGSYGGDSMYVCAKADNPDARLYELIDRIKTVYIGGTAFRKVA